MEPKEIRMRCIEALSSMGVRSTQDLIARAKDLEEWVGAAEDKGKTPKQAPKRE